MQGFKVWDKVRYTEKYLKDWEETVGFPYPFQDIYIIKKQLTRTAYLANWKMCEHRNRILHPRAIESAISEELLDVLRKDITWRSIS